jgi:hypothetical protein
MIRLLTTVSFCFSLLSLAASAQDKPGTLGSAPKPSQLQQKDAAKNPAEGLSVIPPGETEAVPSYPVSPSRRATIVPPEAPTASIGTTTPSAATAQSFPPIGPGDRVQAVEEPPVYRPRDYTNKKAGFSLGYPDDWVQVSHPAMAFQAKPSFDSVDVLRVQVNKVAKGTTAEGYAKAQTKRFAKFWTIDRSEPSVLGGEPAWRISHVQMIDGRVTRAEKLFAVRNGRGYMLDCQSNPSAFAQIKPICASAARLIRFSK